MAKPRSRRRTRQAPPPPAKRPPRPSKSRPKTPPLPPDAVEVEASELITLALEHRRRLTSTERRKVMAWLDGDRYGENGKAYQTNANLARLFGVSETTVIEDRRRIMRDYAATLTPDQAMTIVARYFVGHDRLLAACEKGITSCEAGTMAHREYLKLYSDLAARQVKLAQDIGVVKKELGHVQLSETWVATTDGDGVTRVVPEGGAGLGGGVPIDEEGEEDLA
jgi:hypothetical protein